MTWKAKNAWNETVTCYSHTITCCGWRWRHDCLFSFSFWLCFCFVVGLLLSLLICCFTLLCNIFYVFYKCLLRWKSNKLRRKWNLFLTVLSFLFGDIVEQYNLENIGIRGHFWNLYLFCSISQHLCAFLVIDLHLSHSGNEHPSINNLLRCSLRDSRQKDGGQKLNLGEMVDGWTSATRSENSAERVWSPEMNFSSALTTGWTGLWNNTVLLMAQCNTFSVCCSCFQTASNRWRQKFRIFNHTRFLIWSPDCQQQTGLRPAWSD